jgi:centrosomal protein CEP112
MNKYQINIQFKTISQLESKFITLEQELIESDRLRKQQITELGLLRQEEKEKLTRNHELEIENIKSLHEEENSNLAIQLKQQYENSYDELKAIKLKLNEQEKEFQSEKIILEEKIKLLEAEKSKTLDSFGKEKNNYLSKIEEEKTSLQKHFQILIKVFN